MPHLFEPLTIKGITLRNRIGVSPMCQYSSTDGLANDWHLVHLGSRAVGGAGLVFTEATAVTADGRITAQDLGLWNDEQIEPLQRITRFITAQGAVPGIQLAHAGRKASTWRPWLGKHGSVKPADGGWVPVGPSPIAFDPQHTQPVQLDEEQIAGVIQAFVDAAKRALTAGFKVVAADTPEKIESLNTLAPGKISRVGREGQLYYVFTDPYECRCMWVGQEAQYDRYRRLEAEEMVPTVELTGIEAGPDWFEDVGPW